MHALGEYGHMSFYYIIMLPQNHFRLDDCAIIILIVQFQNLCLSHGGGRFVPRNNHHYLQKESPNSKAFSEGVDTLRSHEDRDYRATLALSMQFFNNYCFIIFSLFMLFAKIIINLHEQKQSKRCNIMYVLVQLFKSTVKSY